MISTAIAAALAAGDVLRRRFGGEVQVNEAFHHDVKIQADIDTQNLIYDVIRKAHPDHVLIGEEGNSGATEGSVEWIVDPIDGTMNFAYGIPHFSISIAARQKGRLVVGVVYDPMRNELFTAEKDGPTRLNGVTQRVSPRTRLDEAVMAVGFSKSQESIDHAIKLYQYYGTSARKLRAMGSAALDLAYVACGRLDAYIEQGISLWDIAAGQLLVEQAGGKFVAESKKEGKYKIIASNGKIDFPLH